MTDPVPPDPETAELVQAGILAYRAGDRRRARELLTAATRRDPRQEQAWLWLSAAHDDVTFKRICLQKVLALNPKNPHARRGLELLDGGAARPTSVFAAPEPAAPSLPPAQPPRPSVGTMRGRPTAPLAPQCPWCQAEFTAGYVLAGRCPRCGRPLAFDCPQCERAVTGLPETCPQCAHSFGKFYADREGYLARLAEAYQAKGWADQALTVVEHLLELAPRSVRYQHQAAQLYDRLEDTPRSINAYRRLLDLEPQNAEALAYLARWYLTLHQTPELKEIGQRLRALPRRSLRLTLLLADVDYETEALRSAEALYRALVRHPEVDAATRARLYWRLGELTLERGQPARAVRDYEASLAAGVDTPETQAARRRLNELRPPLPAQALASYGETLRAMAGPVLLLWLLAGLQAGFQADRLTAAGAAGMVAAVLGSYLLACAWVTPLTLEWRGLLGAGGLSQPLARAVVSLGGGGLLAAAGLLIWLGI